MKIEVMVEIPDGKYCNKCAFQAADSSESALCVFDWSADMITECTFCDTETCEGCTKDTGLLKIDNCPALRAQLERERCENCLHRTALDSHAGLNGCYWHCAIGRGEETKNVWHKYSRHYKDYSLVDLGDFCSSFKPEPPREGKI